MHVSCSLSVFLRLTTAVMFFWVLPRFQAIKIYNELLVGNNGRKVVRMCRERVLIMGYNSPKAQQFDLGRGFIVFVQT